VTNGNQTPAFPCVSMVRFHRKPKLCRAFSASVSSETPVSIPVSMETRETESPETRTLLPIFGVCVCKKRASLSPRERSYGNAQWKRGPLRDLPREIFVVTLQPRPGIDGYRALRRLLKFAGRVLGLRCTRITQQ
jgi:hypothetical protein